VGLRFKYVFRNRDALQSTEMIFCCGAGNTLRVIKQFIAEMSKIHYLDEVWIAGGYFVQKVLRCEIVG
jgi:hypothetical protein